MHGVAALHLGGGDVASPAASPIDPESPGDAPSFPLSRWERVGLPSLAPLSALEDTPPFVLEQLKRRANAARHASPYVGIPSWDNVPPLDASLAVCS